MIHTKPGRTTGFTLTELLVVISIMAVMMAMIIPATQSLKEGNRLNQCQFRLQQIGNAIKMYHADYHGVPPRYSNGTDVGGPGLALLWEMEYLHNRRALHCPNDTDHPDPNTPEYYRSYMDQDLGYTDREGVDWYPKLGAPASEPYYDWNDYKYLSTRGITDPDDLDYKRQLYWAPGDPVYDVPGQTQTWYPDDTSIVTWCNLHANECVRQHEEMYQVLFWDGSVSVIPARRFTDDSMDPPAAWRVRPSDAQLD